MYSTTDANRCDDIVMIVDFLKRGQTTFCSNAAEKESSDETALSIVVSRVVVIKTLTISHTLQMHPPFRPLPIRPTMNPSFSVPQRRPLVWPGFVGPSFSWLPDTCWDFQRPSGPVPIVLEWPPRHASNPHHGNSTFGRQKWRNTWSQCRLP